MTSLWMPSLHGRSGPKYMAIADAISEAVAEGELPTGAKLPPQRNLAYDLGVTLGTITRAYQEAERRGLVDGEVGRGTFVRGGGGPMTAEGGFVMSDETWDGNVDFSMTTPPIGDAGTHLSRTLMELAKEPNLGEILDYRVAARLSKFAEAGSHWFAKMGMEAPPERITLTYGAQHGILLSLMAAVRPGDTVLCESLTYPGVIQVARELDLRLETVEMDDDGIVPDSIDAACRRSAPRALYCIPTLQNPTMRIMSEARRPEVVEQCRKHGLLIIEDQVFGQLLEKTPTALATLAPERTFTVSSISKSVAAGLRTGFILSPSDAMESLRAGIRASGWNIPALTAEISRRWIMDGTADHLTRWQRAETRARQTIAKEALAPFDINSHPQGQHVWLRLPETWRADAFRAEAEKRGLRLFTGEAFAPGHGAIPQAARICICCPPNRDQVAHGVKVIREILESQPTTDAIV